jgi:DNA-binding HxlR family transcriptional regulator
VLRSLYEADELRMGTLAWRAYLSKQTLTELVRRLERDGLVERRPDPGDAREDGGGHRRNRRLRRSGRSTLPPSSASLIGWPDGGLDPERSGSSRPRSLS